MSEQQVIECGKCGNTNLIPEGRSQFYCQYCGSRIILKPTVSEEQAGRVENYLRMARATSNYHHAYEYYSRAITIDSSRPEIWASRGKLAQRIREMIGDFRMAIELDPGNQALIDELAFFAFDKIKRSSLYSFWDLKWVLHYNRSPDVLLFAIESLQPGVEESIKSGGDSEDLIPFYDGLVKEFKQTYPIKAGRSTSKGKRRQRKTNQ